MIDVKPEKGRLTLSKEWQKLMKETCPINYWCMKQDEQRKKIKL